VVPLLSGHARSFASETPISLALELDGLGSIVAVGTSVDRMKSLGEVDEETELVKVADELKNVDLIGVELEILGLVVPGIDNMLDCGDEVLVVEVLVVEVLVVEVLVVEVLVVEVLVVGEVLVGVFIVVAVVRST
jgi:hypothetical protein